jgi:hypothetical protein
MKAKKKAAPEENMTRGEATAIAQAIAEELEFKESDKLLAGFFLLLRRLTFAEDLTDREAVYCEVELAHSHAVNRLDKLVKERMRAVPDALRKGASK